MPEARYRVNEVFYSVQGEGVRAGTANVFVRFSGCNMRCRREEAEDSPGGFDCDTEFVSGRDATAQDINLAGVAALERAGAEWSPSAWMILTGGEPGLQVDRALCDSLRAAGWRLAIETNGSVDLPRAEVPRSDPELCDYLLDWITVSPKVAEHAIRQRVAHEVKYVRSATQEIPRTCVEAEHYVLSPAFDGLEVDRDALQNCLRLVRENPRWRLSVQQHKAWGVL